MAFATTIKKIFMKMKLEDLEKDGFFTEWKEVKPYWDLRIPGVRPGDEAVFLEGHKGGPIVHRHRIIKLTIEKKEKVPEKYRGAISTNQAYGIVCV